MRFGLKLSFLIALIAALAFAGCKNPTSSDPDTTAPAEVSGLTASPGNGSVVLNWTDPTDSDFAKAVITYTPGTAPAVEAAKGTQTAAISGLVNGTAYTFTVKTVDTTGNTSTGTTKTATPASGYTPAYLLPDPTNTNIAAKFGVSTVSDAFTKLHLLISTPEPGHVLTDIIALGDYIDLPSLTVAAYNGQGAISATDAAITATAPFTGYEGRLLRLIVVGINTYSGKNENGTTPHVVFQFQNLPGTHRMNATASNVGGYKDSEMRKYLVEVDGAAGSGNFLAGLTAAGVPESVLWAPSRRVWGGKGSTTADTIEDKLFLPTDWEMFGNNSQSNGTYETTANQGRFTYYEDNPKRIKYNSSNTADWYFDASPHTYTTGEYFAGVAASGASNGPTASNEGGCAPAFCVK